MSTLKADTLTASTTNGSVTIQGNGSGTVAIGDNTAITGTLSATGATSITGPSLVIGDNNASGNGYDSLLHLLGDGSSGYRFGVNSANTELSLEREYYGWQDVLVVTRATGAITGADNELSRVNLKDYGEVTNAIGSTGGGTQDIDLTLGNNVVATVDTSANTFTFSNPTASDELCGFTLFLTNGGSQTVNWPAAVDWAGGTAPTLTTSGLDILVFVTTDGGTIWHGMVSSADSKSP